MVLFLPALQIKIFIFFSNHGSLDLTHSLTHSHTDKKIKYCFHKLSLFPCMYVCVLYIFLIIITIITINNNNIDVVVYSSTSFFLELRKTKKFTTIRCRRVCHIINKKLWMLLKCYFWKIIMMLKLILGRCWWMMVNDHQPIIIINHHHHHQRPSFIRNHIK